MKSPGRRLGPVTQGEYEALAAFRHVLTRFLAFSQAEARAVGLTPRQHQALLAVRGVPRAQRLTIGDLADRLALRHHSAVGLVDRLASLGLVARERAQDDRRRVYLAITPKGRRHLDRLTAVHREELRRVGPRIGALLRRLRAAPDPPSARAGSPR
jgi:DNA-binding MarR family transcriptional regulator